MTGCDCLAPLPVYRQEAFDLEAGTALLDELATGALDRKDWCRWRIVDVDADGRATVYLQDTVKTASRRLLSIWSYDEALAIVEADKETSLGASCVVLRLPLIVLEQHAYFLSSRDIRANSARAPEMCCECDAPLDDAPGITCDGGMPFALGRISLCRRGPNTMSPQRLLSPWAAKQKQRV